MIFQLDLSSPECENENLQATIANEKLTYNISKQEPILRNLSWVTNAAEFNCPTDDLIEIVEDGERRSPTVEDFDIISYDLLSS